jgi:hypothetical protein
MSSPAVCNIDPSQIGNLGADALPPHLACETDCEKLFDVYMACAQAHVHGMNQNSECAPEKKAYKACLAREKAAKAAK